jgi:hypothetical protein
MKNLKKITIISFLIFISIISKSQSSIKTFDIINNGKSVSEVEIYEKIVSESNMENYRCKTRRDTLLFETGIKIILYSAQELYIRGYSINPSEYIDIRDSKYKSPIFKLIIPNGIPQAPGQKPYLIALYNHIEK